MSLRTRLLAVTTCILAVGMSVLCLAGNALLAGTIAGDQRQRLEARLQAVAASLSVDRSGDVRINPTINDELLDSYAWIESPHGHILERPNEAPSALSRIAVSLARSTGPRSVVGPHEVLMGSRSLRVGRRVVATVVASVAIGQLQRLRRAVLVGSIAVVLLILLIGALATRRALGAALAPVEQMTRDADDWSAHDLNRRFDLGPARDEVTHLAATLDHLLTRIAASRRHEQRFASEVAHELRTPLAAIRGVAELNGDTAELEDARRALREIEGHSRRIGTTLDTLVAFARRELSPAAAGVDLAEVLAEFPDVRVERASDPMPRVEGDPALIRQTLAPLIDNARRHAATEVTIELTTAHDRAIIAVRDDGPGLDPGVGEEIFLPGVRGPSATGDGAGLGLPLAQRLVASCGGRLTVGEGPGGCFVLSLPILDV